MVCDGCPNPATVTMEKLFADGWKRIDSCKAHKYINLQLGYKIVEP